MPRFLFLFAIAFSWPALAEESTQSKRAAAELAVRALNDGGTFQDPVDILAWADMPRSATVNETVLLKITVENGRSRTPFLLESIDLGGNFGKGFDIKAVRPKPTEMDSMLNALTLDYSISIAPNERAVIELELIAKKAGVYVGEVDIWEGEKFLTRIAQCKIEE
jgi:hypothetical protein